VVPLEPEEDELEFRLNPTEELDDEDWLEIARMLPNRGPTEEDLDLLGARDIDLQYDWNSHVGCTCIQIFLMADIGKKRLLAILSPQLNLSNNA